MAHDGREEGALATRNDEFVAELRRAHGSQLLQFLARMLGQAGCAREVAENAYEEIRRRDKVQDLVFPRATLYKVAIRFALMRLRRDKSEAPMKGISAAMDPVPNIRTSQDMRISAEEANEKVAQTIRGLRPRLRTVFVMAHLQGIARADIAAQLGISLKRVDKRMTKALRTLRERMGSLGMD
jgi:RNA polymerase sigma-70 factor (ECF subfamily)